MENALETANLLHLRNIIKQYQFTKTTKDIRIRQIYVLWIKLLESAVKYALKSCKYRRKSLLKIPTKFIS